MRFAGSELARARERRGLTQRELAAAIGIKPATLHPVENLHRAAWPKLRAACARILQIPEEELFPEGEQLRGRPGT